jgi:hypothetical protein
MRFAVAILSRFMVPAFLYTLRPLLPSFGGEAVLDNLLSRRVASRDKRPGGSAAFAGLSTMFTRFPRERLADGDALFPLSPVFSRAFDALGELPLATLAARALAIVSASAKLLGFMLLLTARLFLDTLTSDPFAPSPCSNLISFSF